MWYKLTALGLELHQKPDDKTSSCGWYCSTENIALQYPATIFSNWVLTFNWVLSDKNILLIDIWVNCCSQMGESPAHLSTSSFFHSSLKFLAEQKIFRAWSENERKNDLQEKNNFFLSRPLWSGEREVIVVIITDYSPLHRPAPSAGSTNI